MTRLIAGRQPGVRNIPVDASLDERLTALIDTLDAYIEYYHGGRVELVDFDGKTVRVRLGGACVGCALSEATLHGWLEGTIKQFFPEIERVERVSTEEEQAEAAA